MREKKGGNHRADIKWMLFKSKCDYLLLLEAFTPFTPFTPSTPVVRETAGGDWSDCYLALGHPSYSWAASNRGHAQWGWQDLDDITCNMSQPHDDITCKMSHHIKHVTFTVLPYLSLYLQSFDCRAFNNFRARLISTMTISIFSKINKTYLLR